MKTCIAILLCLMVMGCASINKPLLKFDAENYKANKAMAVASMKTWSLNSGFISGLGLTDKIKFPITSAGELRPILNSPPMAIALVDLDDVVRKRGYWSDEDFDYGFFLGTRVRAGSQAAIEFVKSYLPQLMEYAPMLFAL
jgi:hypothetical protein